MGKAGPHLNDRPVWAGEEAAAQRIMPAHDGLQRALQRNSVRAAAKPQPARHIRIRPTCGQLDTATQHHEPLTAKDSGNLQRPKSRKLCFSNSDSPCQGPSSAGQQQPMVSICILNTRPNEGQKLEDWAHVFH